jgi:hypothetical protein
MEKLGQKYNSAVVAIIQCNGGKWIYKGPSSL